MKLNEADGKLFYLLFKPLLYFVNQKYRMYDLAAHEPPNGWRRCHQNRE